ncbi:ABC transporter substrate-binding protein [Stackebrandtia nassauensis]|uniref:Extracellular solute-binding protein family 1 n=1 Tax=Stackebrandtia nassauensis (strain DSM 44728 / CIP 108903 / NRRL B-16338 / NBRC 102104 / LLR-40K-21) TaxID=446470 RepID=D3QC36_STANL|nr:extracellular solute-binding protein [Stackebrandtia nassauensis]ADD39770.1 extracellular solute-binding protein family 1 [Stackebrandtia nassauensis DSM 44728]
MPSLSRRTALRLAAAALLPTSLAACGGGGSGRRQPGETIELTFWNWVPGVDKAVNLWNKQNPEVQIRLSNIPSGPSGGYAKMFAALKAGDPPDLAQVEYYQIPAFLMEQGLEDLTQHGFADHKDKFVDWQWDQGAFGDGVYAVPQASGPMAMYYRADLLEQWNLEPPATWAEFEETAAKIREHDAYICSFPPNDAAMFTSLCWQAGARWFGTSGGEWTVDMDNEPTRKVAEYWQRLIKKDLVLAQPMMANAWYKAVQDGKEVLWVGPQWGDALIKGNAPKTSGKWKVTGMPQWKEGEFASANWGGSSTALFKGGDFPAEALEFAIWLNTDPTAVDLLIEGGYGWPAAAGVFKGSKLDRDDEFFGGRYNDVFAEADKAVDTKWRWTPITLEINENLNAGFQAAFGSGGSFTDVVATAEKQAIAGMKAKGLPVASP